MEHPILRAFGCAIALGLVAYISIEIVGTITILSNMVTALGR